MESTWYDITKESVARCTQEALKHTGSSVEGVFSVTMSSFSFYMDSLAVVCVTAYLLLKIMSLATLYV